MFLSFYIRTCTTSERQRGLEGRRELNALTPCSAPPGAAGLSVKLTDAGDFDCMHFTDRLASCHSRGVNHKRLQLPYTHSQAETQ